MFASEDMFGLTPDIICTAKGLSSGYQPISATLLSDEISDVIGAKDNKFLHGMTYSGHPACCAAALANIAIMENDKLCEHVKTLGPHFENALGSLAQLDIVGEVRGSHFMMGIEFVSNKQSKLPFEDHIAVGMRVAMEAQKRGLIVRPLGHMIVLSPPLILTAEQIDNIASVLDESIQVVIASLQQEGLL